MRTYIHISAEERAAYQAEGSAAVTWALAATVVGMFVLIHWLAPVVIAVLRGGQ